MEFCSVLCAWMGRGWGRMDACTCVAEFLHCPPETITTLVNSYSPTQKAFGVKNKNEF